MTTPAQPFTYAALTGQKIGVQKGTIYEVGAEKMGIRNPIIVSFKRSTELLNALAENKVSYAIVDDLTAIYWAANSSGIFKVVGQPYSFGYGLGIVVSKSALGLLPELNDAINEYLASDDYKQNFHLYLETF